MFGKEIFGRGILENKMLGRDVKQGFQETDVGDGCVRRRRFQSEGL